MTPTQTSWLTARVVLPILPQADDFTAEMLLQRSLSQSAVYQFFDKRRDFWTALSFYITQAINAIIIGGVDHEDKCASAHPPPRERAARSPREPRQRSLRILLLYSPVTWCESSRVPHFGGEGSRATTAHARVSAADTWWTPPPTSPATR